MHFFIRRQTNGRTWRGRANQNPMRRQRPPIKRSLPKPPVTNPRAAARLVRVWHRSARWPYALCVYFEYTYLYAGFARSRSAFRVHVDRGPGATRTGHPFPFPSPRLVTGPFKIWNAVTAKICRKFVQCSRTAGYAAREEAGQLEMGWPSYERFRTTTPSPHPLATWRIEFLSGITPSFPFLSHCAAASQPRCVVRKKSLDSLRKTVAGDCPQQPPVGDPAHVHIRAIVPC